MDNLLNKLDKLYEKRKKLDKKIDKIRKKHTKAINIEKNVFLKEMGLPPIKETEEEGGTQEAQEIYNYEIAPQSKGLWSAVIVGNVSAINKIEELIDAIREKETSID